jgi:hypothetical protein
VDAASAKPRDCIDDRISNGRCDETHSLSLMVALRVNSGTAKQKDRPKAVSGLRTSQSSNVPRRNSSPTTSVAAAVVTSVNAAFGNCSQTARSSAVTVSHPNLNMYRPGSVTRPTCAQVTLLTANHFPFAFSLLERIRFNSRAFIFTDPT